MEFGRATRLHPHARQHGPTGGETGILRFAALHGGLELPAEIAALQ